MNPLSLVDLLLLAALWPGHAAAWTYPLNLAYSRPWPKSLLRGIRALCGVVIVALPIAVAIFGGTAFRESLATPPGLAYAALCGALGWVALPWVTLRRVLRPRPVAHVSESSEVVDIAAELGVPIAGTGQRARQARLPFNQVFQVEFSRLELAPEGLPAALDGLTILHLSDLHFVGTPELPFYREVARRCGEMGTPDIVAITGDIVDGPDFHEWVAPALGALRWREAGLAILGNHDWQHDPGPVRAALAALNFAVLGNGTARLTVRGVPVLVAGHEGPWFRPETAVPAPAAGEFRLLLSHTPDHLGWARQRGFHLMLAGHNHGGQIRIPGFGPIFVPSRYSRRYDMGTFEEPPTTLHVSRGLGGKSPLRWFCRPQVSWITLRARHGGATPPRSAEFAPGRQESGDGNLAADGGLSDTVPESRVPDGPAP